MSQLEQLYKQFEKEVFLYMANELPSAKMEFWNTKLQEFPELNKCVKEVEFVETHYDRLNNVELPEEKFESFINFTLTPQSNKDRMKIFLKNLFMPTKELSFGRIAFASLLIIAAIIVSLISNRPNPVIKIADSINNELLDWDAELVDDKISKVETLLKVTQDDEYRKYYKYKLRPTNIDKNINLISNDIESLKKELNKKEL